MGLGQEEEGVVEKLGVGERLRKGEVKVEVGLWWLVQDLKM